MMITGPGQIQQQQDSESEGFVWIHQDKHTFEIFLFTLEFVCSTFDRGRSCISTRLICSSEEWPPRPRVCISAWRTVDWPGSHQEARQDDAKTTSRSQTQLGRRA